MKRGIIKADYQTIFIRQSQNIKKKIERAAMTEKRTQ